MNSSEEMQEADKFSQLFGLIEGLGERLENRLQEIQINMDTFRQEIKDEIKGLKKTVAEIEKSLEEVWSHIDDNKEQLKAQKEIKECQQNEIDEMKSELARLSTRPTGKRKGEEHGPGELHPAGKFKVYEHSRTRR